MNDLDELRGLRADLTPADPAALARARAAMFHPRPRRVRRRWLLLPAAATAALALVAGVGVWGGGPDRPAAGPPPRTQDRIEDPLTPDLVLRGAATRVAQEQPLAARNDQFVYVESAVGGPEGMVTPANTTFVRSTRKIWLSVDGTRDGLLIGKVVPGRGEERITLDGCGDGKGCTPIRNFHDNLPSDVAALQAWFDQQIAARNKGAVAKEKVADRYAWAIASALLGEAYVPPATRAAIFTVLSRTTGLSVVRDVVDAAGRTGVSVGITSEYARSEIIFDPSTYQYLGQRVVGLEDSQFLRKGQVASESAQLKIAIVDRPGQIA
ncbi:CU044_5270 family protein [Virgisporangium aurantiacum]|uniref:CU044_5270 family protein n=1 Tax=Virgisporangium aurantiacum TaxID=175570 RepID=A0A8J4E8H2_9ACTN|nr:CU044_5270 family protein [Virgisporangium aurantiacum]GIJ62787.1 hypothetical protein Vau01_103030 [Virgisporangium aurantiacum]